MARKESGRPVTRKTLLNKHVAIVLDHMKRHSVPITRNEVKSFLEGVEPMGAQPHIERVVEASMNATDLLNDLHVQKFHTEQLENKVRDWEQIGSVLNEVRDAKRIAAISEIVGKPTREDTEEVEDQIQLEEQESFERMLNEHREAGALGVLDVPARFQESHEYYQLVDKVEEAHGIVAALQSKYDRAVDRLKSVRDIMVESSTAKARKRIEKRRTKRSKERSMRYAHPKIIK